MINDNLSLDKLENLSGSDRLSCLVAYLKKLFCRYLHIENDVDLDSGQSFFELGMASLTALQVQYELQNTLNIKLNSSVLYNYPSINLLAEFLLFQKLIFVADATEEMLGNDYKLSESHSNKTSKKDADFGKVKLVDENWGSACSEEVLSDYAKQMLNEEFKL